MDLIQPLAAVVLVMALLGGVLFLLKRRGFTTASNATRRMQVLERISLTPQHALHLVRAQDRVLLIATAPGTCQLLSSNEADHVA